MSNRYYYIRFRDKPDIKEWTELDVYYENEQWKVKDKFFRTIEETVFTIHENENQIFKNIIFDKSIALLHIKDDWETFRLLSNETLKGNKITVIETNK